MTPRQLERAIRARVTQADREHNKLAWLAWHVAALSRAKKLPKLEALFVKTRRQTVQSPEQMLTMIRALNAAFGGTVKEKKGS